MRHLKGFYNLKQFSFFPVGLIPRYLAQFFSRKLCGTGIQCTYPLGKNLAETMGLPGLEPGLFLRTTGTPPSFALFYQLNYKPRPQRTICVTSAISLLPSAIGHHYADMYPFLSVVVCNHLAGNGVLRASESLSGATFLQVRPLLNSPACFDTHPGPS